MKKQKNAQLVLPREEWPYEVPENWIWTRLENVLESVKEKTDSFNASLKYVGLENIEKDTGTIDFQFADEVKSTKTIFGQGNILYGRLRPYLNKHGLVPFDGICSTDILVFNSKEISLNQFVDYYFHLPIFIEYTVANSKGINLPRVTESTVLDAKFPLPPRPEQQRIVARIESLFAKLDAATEKIHAALDQFPTRKAAILHKAFTGELTKKWREENGVGMESWEETTLKDETLQIGDGLHGTPNFDKLGKYYFVNGNNLNDDCIQIKNDTKRINEIEYEKYKVELSSNTVLLSINGTLGKTAFYRKEPIILGKSACYINVSKKLNKNFLRYYFNTWFFRDYANEKATGSTIKNLGLKAIREMPLYLPTFSEQKEIVRILDAIFEREQAAKETAERLWEQIALTKKSILARAFRGLLGTNDPKEKSAEGWLEEKNSPNET